MNKRVLVPNVLFLAALIPLGSFAQAPTPAPIFHSTLDGTSASYAPARGTGTYAAVQTSPGNDFRRGGVRIDAPGEHVRFAQFDGTTANINLTRGTVEFLFQPNFDSNDGTAKRVLFASCTWATKGCFYLHKMNGGNRNNLSVVFWKVEPETPPIQENSVEAASYHWVPGQLVKLRLTWDLQAQGQIFHLYMNDVEVPITSEVTQGPRQPASPSTSDYIFVGGRSVSANGNELYGGGTFYDIKIWDVALPPQPAGCTAPAASN